MRIAFVVGSPPKKLGSLEQWTVGVCAEARRRGHDVALFTCAPVHGAVLRELQALGVSVDFIASLQAAPWAASRRLARYDLAYVNLVLPRSRVALCCYVAWPAKVVFVDHCSGAASPPPWSVGRALDPVTLARVDALVGVSEYVRARDARRFGIDEARTRVIYNGVDLTRFTPSDPPGLGLRMLCVAQLIPEKGVDVLLRALALARSDATLSIAGYGRMESSYAALAGELGLGSRVSFLGMRDDVPALLQRANVLVHPAIWEEAFGLTIAEGMASARAVIATRSGAIPELIDDGENGLLVPKGDARALARAIDALGSDTQLRERLGAAGRHKVERAFSLSRCVSQHVDCMEEVVALKPRVAPLRPPAAPACRAEARGSARPPAAAEREGSIGPAP